MSGAAIVLFVLGGSLILGAVIDWLRDSTRRQAEQAERDVAHRRLMKEIGRQP